jgi:hypothetical protein
MAPGVRRALLCVLLAAVALEAVGYVSSSSSSSGGRAAGTRIVYFVRHGEALKNMQRRARSGRRAGWACMHAA